MGDVVKQDLAVSIEVMLELQRLFENDYQGSFGQQRLEVVQAATFCELAFCASLRGFEIPKTDLAGLRENRVHSTDPGWGDMAAHIGLPLVGRFKSEQGEQCHVLPIVERTASGLEPMVWVDRLVEEMELRGKVSGWAFIDGRGNQARMGQFGELIYDQLIRIQETRPDLISPHLDVMEEYGLARSFRRGSNTQAQNKKVPGPVIDWMNRWRSEENAKGKESRGTMRVLYAEVKLMLGTFLQYSEPL